MALTELPSFDNTDRENELAHGFKSAPQQRRASTSITFSARV